MAWTMDRSIGLRSDDFGWFGMVPDGLVWFAVSPDLAWPSGSDLERPWTDPDPTWSGHGPTRTLIWIGWDRIGSDWIRLVLLWTVLGPTSSVLGPTWANQAPHGADLGRLEPQVRPSYRYLGTRWGHHGASLGSHEAILALTWANQAPHGANQPRYGRDLAPNWGQFGSPWSCVGPSCYENHCFST